MGGSKTVKMNADQKEWWDYALDLSKILAPYTAFLIFMHMVVKAISKYFADGRTEQMMQITRDVNEKEIMPKFDKLYESIDRLSETIINLDKKIGK